MKSKKYMINKTKYEMAVYCFEIHLKTICCHFFKKHIFDKCYSIEYNVVDK